MYLLPPSTHRPSTRTPPRSVNINGRWTSLRLEPAFWEMLREIAAECGLTVKAFIEGIIITKNPTWPLSSALRLYIAQYFRNVDGRLRFLDVEHGTRRARSKKRGISDSGRPPRPRAA